MRNRYIQFSIAAILLIQAVSCRKFLEQESFNNIAIDQVFSDFEGARTTLVGCYERLISSSYYMRDFHAYPEVTGGNIKYSKTSALQQALSFNFANTPQENDLRAFYQNAYQTIYAVNNVIERVDDAADASDLQKNRMVADALTLRALVHFDLVRAFAQNYFFTPDASHEGVVMYTRNQNPVDPVPAPSSVKEVFDQVVADLDSAIALYPNSMAIYSGGNPKTWLSLDAAKALLSRVCLYKGDWSRVVELATEIIEPNNYRLLTRAQYVNSWNGKTISNESIFELAFGTRPAESLGSFYSPEAPGTFQWAATEDVLGLYQPSDIRSAENMYVQALVSGTTFYYTKKYQGRNELSNNVKIIRASELYLNRAEAYAEMNMLTEALADLNTIRKRAISGATDFVSNDQQEVLNEILLERRRELCFEGHLFFDIARKQKDLIRTDVVSDVPNLDYPDPRYASPKPIFQ